MRTVIALTLCLAATSAAAQVRPFHHPWPTTGEQHRYEMDRLRARADEQAAFARQQTLNARLTLLQLQAARLPAPVELPALRALRSPEEERRLRESAAARRETTVESVGQIDAWLDRRPQ